MSEITFSSEMPVTLIDSMGGDHSVVRAARVAYYANEEDAEAVATLSHGGLIRFLARNRHGSPFEHNSFTFFVKAPIFVFREMHRHRIGFSYNEQSGRYSVLAPEFYVPSMTRPGMLAVAGSKAGDYSYQDADELLANIIGYNIRNGSKDAYTRYEYMLGRGVAKEVARMVLPVNIFSSMYVTCNARSIMSFLSLRKRLTQAVPKGIVTPGVTTFDTESYEVKPTLNVKVEWEGEAMFASKPQFEIEQVANQIEALWKVKMPVTHAAFVAARYVAP